jgi:hypothetical protein
MDANSLGLEGEEQGLGQSHREAPSSSHHTLVLNDFGHHKPLQPRHAQAFPGQPAGCLNCCICKDTSSLAQIFWLSHSPFAWPILLHMHRPTSSGSDSAPPTHSSRGSEMAPGNQIGNQPSQEQFPKPLGTQSEYG